MISSVSRAPMAFTTGGAQSAAEVMAERMAQGLANGEIHEDPALGTVTIIPVPESLTHQPAFIERQIVHKNAAGRSMDIIQRELGKLDAMIAKRRPDLGAGWDFRLVDGEFKVSGLPADDAKWLEGRLNANSALMDAASAFISTAVDELETTTQTPAHVDYNYLSRRMERYDFSNVAEQLSEKLSFRELLQDADVIFDSRRINLDAASRGMSGLNVAANRLTANSPPLERAGVFFSTSYGA